MNTEQVLIGTIPAVLYGAPAEQGYLFLHGQMGHKEEAEAFAQLVCPKGYQVLSIDLPGHGARQDRGEELTPWAAVPDIQAALNWVAPRWHTVSLRATSIGAYFAMLAVEAPARALLVSPVLDMEALIQTMMGWAGNHCYHLRPDLVLELPVLGTGTPGPPVDLSRPHSLRKRGQFNTSSNG